jgi:hypothetical protein
VLALQFLCRLFLSGLAVGAKVNVNLVKYVRPVVTLTFLRLKISGL